jgi:aldose 1-epimerase
VAIRDIRVDEFGQLGDGRRIARFTLEAPGGLQAQIVNYGGTLVSLVVPDRAGRPADVVLGFDDLAGYVGGQGYLGALIGRHANRIGRARFSLGGTLYQLTANDGVNQLHGGLAGFDRAVWRAAPRETPAGPAVDLEYLSRDGEEGYPGNLAAHATYTLEADGLRIDYAATTDQDTVVSLTNHTYWNLAGHAGGSILDHRLVIDAERFAVVGPGQIPTGELRAVAGTPFDFRAGAAPGVAAGVAIGARIDDPDDQLRVGAGYDHSFAIDGTDGVLRRAARVVEPVSGRVLEAWTTEPALQFYAGNHLDGMRGKAGAAYHRRTGFCLETQHHPDAPNQPAFASTVLRAGAQYRSTTVYRLLAEAPLSRTD